MALRLTLTIVAALVPSPDRAGHRGSPKRDKKKGSGTFFAKRYLTPFFRSRTRVEAGVG
jgi:hypothetical protein